MSALQGAAALLVRSEQAGGSAELGAERPHSKKNALCFRKGVWSSGPAMRPCRITSLPCGIASGSWQPGEC